MDTRRLGIIGLGKKACLDLHQLLDVFNSSSGVNFATQNRFPKIVGGDYLESGLSSKLMTKDVVLYIDLVRTLGGRRSMRPACWLHCLNKVDRIRM